MSSYKPRPFRSVGRRRIRGDNIMLGLPNFTNEWGEIAPTSKGHYDDFKALGFIKWIALAKKGGIIKYTPAQAKKIENTEAYKPTAFTRLKKIKQQRVKEQIENKKIELSIVARYSDNFKILVAGNTRFTGQMYFWKIGYVWEFFVPDDVAMLK